jgi:hypothetical protein
MLSVLATLTCGASSGCDSRVFPYDDHGIGDEAGESSTGDTSESGADDSSESETGGSVECKASVTTLSINDDTDPATVECLTKVGGDLVIGPTSELLDLSMLGELREVGGTLYIVGNLQLESLAGLAQLQKVGWLHVRRNGSLLDLGGLDTLVFTDRISIINNDALTSLAGLPAGLAPRTLEVAANDALVDLDGLPTFVAAESGVPIDVVIGDHLALTSVAGLASCCSTQPIALELARNHALTDLHGLEPFLRFDELLLIDNRKLDDLSGIDASEIGTFELNYDPCTSVPTPALEDFAGLEQLISVDVMTIENNPALLGFDGLDSLVELEKLYVRNNAALPWADVQAFEAKFGTGLAFEGCGGIGGTTCAPAECPE